MSTLSVEVEAVWSTVTICDRTRFLPSARPYALQASLSTLHLSDAFSPSLYLLDKAEISSLNSSTFHVSHHTKKLIKPKQT